MDPEMQQVIHESTTINGREKFRYYMQHPNFAPKLQKLIKAGLLKIDLELKCTLKKIIHFSNILDCKISSTGIILLIA
jgi:hypothetical protein